MINGTKGEGRVSKVSRRQQIFITRWQFLAVLVALVIVIPTFIFLSYAKEPKIFAVDGDFGEWSGVDKFGVYPNSLSGPIAITEWAVQTDESRLFLYVSTEGTIMSTSDVSSYYLFVDSDSSTTTGYLVSGIGADYLLQLDGWNGSVQGTALSEYGSTGDRYDWNSWDNVGSLSAMSSGNGLEAMAEMSFNLETSARFMLLAQNSLEQRSISYTPPETGGLLIVEVEAGTGVLLGGLVDQDPGITMMRLKLTCDGSDGTISSITPLVSGATLVSAIEDIPLQPGEEQTVDVVVDTSLANVGSLAYISVNEAQIESTFADVQVIGDDFVKAYVVSAPSSIVIDGAFADWTGRTTTDTELITLENDNIDIDAVGAVNGTSSSAFYVSVKGEMCSGSYVPVIKQKPSGGGGGIVIPTRKTGEDLLRIYIDSDMNNTTGQIVTLSSKVIGADRMLEITGLNGEIVSKSIKTYSFGSWTYTSGTINAANDKQRLEVDVSSSSLGGASSIDFIVETTDWRARTDLATAVPSGARSIGGGASILSWPIESPTTSSSATAMSYQRKMFYDGVNFWSFYFDGANTVYRYSTNNGQTWISGGRGFSTNGVDEASVWYDSATNTVYVIGDRSAASTTVRVRQGTVSPAAHTITWSSNDYAPTVSTVALGGKNTYISKDRSGYMWLVSSNCTQTTPTRYELSVFKGNLVNSTQTWHHSGNMLIGSIQTQPNIKGSIVNVGAASDMLAVYAYQGNVASRTFTTSWSIETVIYAIGGGNPGNTDLAPPSVVVDNRGTAHVVYGNGHEQVGTSLPFIYYVYGKGSGWSVPYRLDSQKNNEGAYFPTISVDSATGNVFAIWIDGSGGVGTAIEAKKNVTGTWTSLSVSSDTTSPKQYLTSIYSAPSEDSICWQWTQNTTGTIEIEFDKMPEFSQLTIPVLGMAALFMFVYRKRSSRPKKKPSKD